MNKYPNVVNFKKTSSKIHRKISENVNFAKFDSFRFNFKLDGHVISGPDLQFHRIEFKKPKY